MLVVLCSQKTQPLPSSPKTNRRVTTLSKRIGKKLALVVVLWTIPPFRNSAQNGITWLAKVAQDVTIAPRCQHVFTAKLYLETRKEFPPLVCIEQAAIHIQGILTARALWKVGTVRQDTARPTRQPTQAKVVMSENSVHVMLANLSHGNLTVP